MSKTAKQKARAEVKSPAGSRSVPAKKGGTGRSGAGGVGGSGSGRGKLLAENRRARHHYEVEDSFEVGMVLQGWEVKAMRAGRSQLSESHVVVRRSELFLLNCHVSPLSSSSTHVDPRPTRTRKLLLHGGQIKRLIGKVREAGMTLIPLDLHLSRGKIKLQVALARGKKRHDKRETLKRREWDRQKARIMRGKRG